MFELSLIVDNPSQGAERVRNQTKEVKQTAEDAPVVRRASVAFTCDIKLEALGAEVIHEIAEEDSTRESSSFPKVSVSDDRGLKS
jgi:hypothetical protein